LLLGILGILPFGIIYIYGEQLFVFVLGEEWRASGTYAEFIAVWMFFVIMNSPSLSIMQIFRKQNYLLIYEVINFSVRLSVLFYGVNYLNIEETIKYFSYCGAVTNGVLILISSYLVLKIEGNEE
ncbi:MAG: hypothetical protein R3321_14855, partial [Nitrososphaeraceae archaeon]|nr:hypothetical protein [Nitrososphaeraceae archaeon]